MHQTAEIKDGKLAVGQAWGNMIANMFDGRYLISFTPLNPQSDIKTYMRLYFLKVDIIAKEVGEDRYQVHEYAKEYILHDMAENNPELFEKVIDRISTVNLTEQGWIAYIDAFDIWAFINYNIILN